MQNVLIEERPNLFYFIILLASSLIITNSLTNFRSSLILIRTSDLCVQKKEKNDHFDIGKLRKFILEAFLIERFVSAIWIL